LIREPTEYADFFQQSTAALNPDPTRGDL